MPVCLRGIYKKEHSDHNGSPIIVIAGQLEAERKYISRAKRSAKALLPVRQARNLSRSSALEGSDTFLEQLCCLRNTQF